MRIGSKPKPVALLGTEHEVLTAGCPPAACAQLFIEVVRNIDTTLLLSTAEVRPCYLTEVISHEGVLALPSTTFRLCLGDVP